MGPELNFSYIKVCPEFDKATHKTLPIPRVLGETGSIVRFKGTTPTYNTKEKSYEWHSFNFVAYDHVADKIKRMGLRKDSELVIRGEMQWERFQFEGQDETNRLVCKILALDYQYSCKRTLPSPSPVKKDDFLSSFS